MTAVDTNVLFYAHDSRDSRKQRIAVDLIRTLREGVLLWQVACEYLWASRKLEPQGFSYVDAMADIAGLRRAWRTVLPAWNVLDRIGILKSKRGFSHWDALLIGTCLEARIETLVSEDFEDCRIVETLQIVNPFSTPGA
jgi:predicted nucleic acid-binding protein